MKLTVYVNFGDKIDKKKRLRMEKRNYYRYVMRKKNAMRDTC